MEVSMDQHAQEIANRIASFKDEVVAYVETLSTDDWGKICEWEQWPVGVTAYHLGDGHFAIYKLIKMIIDGKELPQLTMDQINAGSKQNAQAHLDCTKTDALDRLRQNGAAFVSFVAGLSDDDLARQGSMPAFGGAVSVAQVIDYVVFQSGQEHFDSMQAAVGRP
jgi:hypothetical protein